MPNLGTITVKLDAGDLLRRLGLAIKRINELEARPSLDFLSPKFLESMNDIGRYGHEKYGETCFHCKGVARDIPRKRAFQIAEHAEEHFFQYLRGTPHDHFNTRRHQLAAVAFNAMMEFALAGLEDE